MRLEKNTKEVLKNVNIFFISRIPELNFHKSNSKDQFDILAKYDVK